jgi:hypothetical protein
MDQIPYPGPSIWFHIRVISLFIILWLVDVIAFAVAVNNTMNNGVGGMVLFANEVRLAIRVVILLSDMCIVRYSDGQFTEFHGQICHQFS